MERLLGTEGGITEKMENASRIINLYTEFQASKLLDAYTVVDVYCLENHNKAIRFMVNEPAVMEAAAYCHFLKQHEDLGGTKDDFNFKQVERPEEHEGVHTAILVEVKLLNESDSTVYQIKSHHYASRLSKDDTLVKSGGLGLSEMYIYKLLELLKVGPKAQFIISNGSFGKTPAPALYVINNLLPSYCRILLEIFNVSGTLSQFGDTTSYPKHVLTKTTSK